MNNTIKFTIGGVIIGGVLLTGASFALLPEPEQEEMCASLKEEREGTNNINIIIRIFRAEKELGCLE